MIKTMSSNYSTPFHHHLMRTSAEELETYADYSGDGSVVPFNVSFWPQIGPNQSILFDHDYNNLSSVEIEVGPGTAVGSRSKGPGAPTGCVVLWDLDNYIMVTVLPIIFCVSVLGNCLVIVTILQNKRMRTVTNMFLFNLAISDLLLSVFCVPQFLTMTLFKCFLFGAAMCKIFSYMQPLAVTASACTLVVIALERYFGICDPLHSRRWQTRKHAMKMIGSVWIISLVANFPLPFFYQLMEHQPKQYNCRDEWPNIDLKRGYFLFIFLLLFLLPFLIMAALYGVVVITLWTGMQVDLQSCNGEQNPSPQNSLLPADVSKTGIGYQRLQDSKFAALNGGVGGGGAQNFSASFMRKLTPSRTPSSRVARSTALRSTHSERNLVAKKRVIKMLAAIVVEFFVCWMPLFTIRILLEFEILGFSRPIIRSLKFFLMLAYCSSCTNPVTYCFMNSKFRQAFLAVFGCVPKSSPSSPGTHITRNGSSLSNFNNTKPPYHTRLTPTTPGSTTPAVELNLDVLELRENGVRKRSSSSAFATLDLPRLSDQKNNAKDGAHSSFSTFASSSTPSPATTNNELRLSNGITPATTPTAADNAVCNGILRNCNSKPILV